MKKDKNISISDLKEWENYTKNPADIFDKDSNENPLKKINFHEKYKFDLHGYSLDEANLKVSNIIISCSKKKYKEILLITGKGLHSKTDSDAYVSMKLSKLRYSIPEYIKSNPNLYSLIISISAAEKKDGGDGAIILKLK